MAIALVLAILALLILPSASTSRTLLDAQKDFQVKLRHVDSGANLTKFELLRRALKRDEKRLQSLYPMALTASHYSIESPIHYDGRVGEFLMDLSIGTPPRPYSAILDTGSDLIWTQCKPCKQCFHQPNPIFDPKKSSSFSKLPCSNNLCTALPTWSCSRDKSCEYLYPYNDGSSTGGFLATETMRFGKVLIPKVGFGCGINNTAEGGDGTVGLGPGTALSLVSQLNVTMFSYCLPSMFSNETGTLSMDSFACGKTTDQSDSIRNTTPLIKNRHYPFNYYLSLEGITVGHTQLHINKSTFEIKGDGSGGMIIDSGTPLTYIEGSAFNLTKKELIKQVKLPVVDMSSETKLDLCFKLTPKARHFIFPKLIFHFKGVDLALPKENYILDFENLSVACLAMGGSSGFSIFGNILQQNIQVVYDLKRETITFVPRNCDQL